jgi:hypothetical protein
MLLLSPLHVPPGTAMCLACAWRSQADNAGAAAHAHTLANRHPTAYRPPAALAAPAQIVFEHLAAISNREEER